MIITLRLHSQGQKHRELLWGRSVNRQALPHAVTWRAGNERRTVQQSHGAVIVGWANGKRNLLPRHVRNLSRQAGALAVSGVHLLGKVPAHGLQTQHVTHAIRHDDLDDLIVGQDLEGNERCLLAPCLRMCLVGVRVPGEDLSCGVLVSCHVVCLGRHWYMVRGVVVVVVAVVVIVVVVLVVVVIVVVVVAVAVVVVLPCTSLVADVVGGCGCACFLVARGPGGGGEEDNERRTGRGRRGAALAFAIWRSPSTPT